MSFKAIDSLKGTLIGHRVRRSNYYAPFYQASMTLLRNSNVAYIENSKVGCTKIKKCLLELDNWPKRWDEMIEKEVHIHNKELTNMVGPKKLTGIGLYTVLNDPSFYRFGFVRNPYDRLLSAYKDKILAPQKSPDKRNYVSVACKIKAHSTGESARSINLDNTPVSFSEFVDFVEKQRAYDMDRHWFHQYLTMWHPYCKFHFIGRFEQFSSDLEQVLINLGAPDQLVKSARSRDNASFSSKRKYYTGDVAEKVHKTFKTDFDTYGYDKNSWSDY